MRSVIEQFGQFSVQRDFLRLGHTLPSEEVKRLALVSASTSRRFVRWIRFAGDEPRASISPRTSKYYESDVRFEAALACRASGNSRSNVQPTIRREGVVPNSSSMRPISSS